MTRGYYLFDVRLTFEYFSPRNLTTHSCQVWWNAAFLPCRDSSYSAFASLLFVISFFCRSFFLLSLFSVDFFAWCFVERTMVILPSNKARTRGLGCRRGYRKRKSWSNGKTRFLDMSQTAGLAFFTYCAIWIRRNSVLVERMENVPNWGRWRPLLSLACLGNEVDRIPCFHLNWEEMRQKCDVKSGLLFWLHR